MSRPRHFLPNHRFPLVGLSNIQELRARLAKSYPLRLKDAKRTAWTVARDRVKEWKGRPGPAGSLASPYRRLRF